MATNLEAPKLEVLKGSGGSIRVGTTGTIGSLMTKELDMKSTPQASIPPRRKVSTLSVSVPCGFINNPRKLHPRATANEASTSTSTSTSSNNNNNNNNKTIKDGQSNSTQKTRRKSTHHIPILTSDNAAVEITPNRENADKKATHKVEVVDIRCGNPHKWSSPLANRFKKLNSSKLSETIG